MSAEVRREVEELLTEQDLGDETFAQWWDVCDDCQCATTVSTLEAAGVPDPEEWDRSQCLVCGSRNLTFGNGDPLTTDEMWSNRLAAARAERDQARGIACDLEGECAQLEQERDALLLEVDLLRQHAPNWRGALRANAARSREPGEQVTPE